MLRCEAMRCTLHVVLSCTSRLPGSLLSTSSPTPIPRLRPRHDHGRVWTSNVLVDADASVNPLSALAAASKMGAESLKVPDT